MCVCDMSVITRWFLIPVAEDNDGGAGVRGGQPGLLPLPGAGRATVCHPPDRHHCLRGRLQPHAVFQRGQCVTLLIVGHFSTGVMVVCGTLWGTSPQGSWWCVKTLGHFSTGVMVVCGTLWGTSPQGSWWCVEHWGTSPQGSWWCVKHCGALLHRGHGGVSNTVGHFSTGVRWCVETLWGTSPQGSWWCVKHRGTSPQGSWWCVKHCGALLHRGHGGV